MIRFKCPACGDEQYVSWHDVKKPLRCRCIRCGAALVFACASEEYLLKKVFKRKENNP